MKAKQYLETEGMYFEIPFEELQNKIAQNFGERADEYSELNELIACGAIEGTDELYELPSTKVESTSLFSVDRNRYLKNFRFIADILKRKRPNSAVDFGSGDGLFLGYLGRLLPNASLLGIERSENLARIAEQERGIPTICGDYLKAKNNESKLYDLGICNFGWENKDFAPSTRPHFSRTIGKFEICQHCAEDLAHQLVAYFEAWGSWLTKDAYLLVCGRIQNPTMGWAFASAAKTAGWSLSMNDSDILVVNSEQGFHERFPHLVFKRGKGAPPFESDQIGSLRWKAA